MHNVQALGEQHATKYPRNDHHLFVSIRFNVNGNKFPLKALVDTGAEVNVIRKGIIPTISLKYLKYP